MRLLKIANRALTNNTQMTGICLVLIAMGMTSPTMAQTRWSAECSSIVMHQGKSSDSKFPCTRDITLFKDPNKTHVTAISSGMVVVIDGTPVSEFDSNPSFKVCKVLWTNEKPRVQCQTKNLKTWVFFVNRSGFVSITTKIKQFIVNYTINFQENN